MALALPTLEAMLDGNGAAWADGTPLPKRYALVFAGTSMGMGYNDPSRPGYYRPEPRDMFVPDTVGPGYDLKLALLSGAVDAVAVTRLEQAIARRESCEGDAALKDLLDQIDLRAQVELAKFRKRAA